MSVKDFTGYSGSDIKVYADGRLSGATSSISFSIDSGKSFIKKRRPVTINVVAMIVAKPDAFDMVKSFKDSVITLDLHNEYGGHFLVKISGVRLVSRSVSATINDITIDTSYVFKAKKVEYIYNEQKSN
jgi:hypothetical protein